MGATVSNHLTILTIPRAAYRSGQLKIQLKTADSYQHSESSFVHDDNDVYMSTYGTIFSNAQLGDVSAVINGANIEVKIEQFRPNLDVRVVATAMK